MVGSTVVLGGGCIPILYRIALSSEICICSLGVLLDLDDQVADVASSVYQLWLIPQLHPFLGKEDLASYPCPSHVSV